MGRRRWDGVNAVLVLIALVPAVVDVVLLRFGRYLPIDTSGLTDGQLRLYFYVLPFVPAFAVTVYLLATSLRSDPPAICVDNRSGVDLTVVVEGVPDDHECRRFGVPAGAVVRRAPSRSGAQLSIGTAAAAYTADGTQVVRLGEPLWVSQRWVIGRCGDGYSSDLVAA